MDTRQFILKTLLPYKEDSSKCALSPDNGGCVYLTKDGKKCAVGVWMKDGAWQQSTKYFEDLSYAIHAYGQYGLSSVDDIFLPEAAEQNLSNDQWIALQEYHDAIALSGVPSANEALDTIEKLFGLSLPELRFS